MADVITFIAVLGLITGSSAIALAYTRREDPDRRQRMTVFLAVEVAVSAVVLALIFLR